MGPFGDTLLLLCILTKLSEVRYFSLVLKTAVWWCCWIYFCTKINHCFSACCLTLSIFLRYPSIMKTSKPDICHFSLWLLCNFKFQVQNCCFISHSWAHRNHWVDRFLLFLYLFLPPWWCGCTCGYQQTSHLLSHTGPSRCFECWHPHVSHLWHRSTYADILPSLELPGSDTLFTSATKF